MDLVTFPLMWNITKTTSSVPQRKAETIKYLHIALIQQATAEIIFQLSECVRQTETE